MRYEYLDTPYANLDKDFKNLKRQLKSYKRRIKKISPPSVGNMMTAIFKKMS